MLPAITAAAMPAPMPQPHRASARSAEVVMMASARTTDAVRLVRFRRFIVFSQGCRRVEPREHSFGVRFGIFTTPELTTEGSSFADALMPICRVPPVSFDVATKFCIESLPSADAAPSPSQLRGLCLPVDHHALLRMCGLAVALPLAFAHGRAIGKCDARHLNGPSHPHRRG
jgi:hypothetical protein